MRQQQQQRDLIHGFLWRIAVDFCIHGFVWSNRGNNNNSGAGEEEDEDNNNNPLEEDDNATTNLRGMTAPAP